jgi:two-component system, LytTR family, response regulator
MKHFLQPQNHEAKMLSIFLTSLRIGGNLIPFPDQRGLQFIKACDILYMKSESNYTHVYFVNGRKMFLSKTMKRLFTYLPEKQFVRIHHSYVVNKEFITSLKRTELILNEIIHLPVSRRFDKKSI